MAAYKRGKLSCGYVYHEGCSDLDNYQNIPYVMSLSI